MARRPARRELDPQPQMAAGNVVWWVLQSLSPLALVGILFFAGWTWRDFDQVKQDIASLKTVKADVDHLKSVIERIDMNTTKKGARSYERGKTE